MSGAQNGLSWYPAPGYPTMGGSSTSSAGGMAFFVPSAPKTKAKQPQASPYGRVKPPSPTRASASASANSGGASARRPVFKPPSPHAKPQKSASRAVALDSGALALGVGASFPAFSLTNGASPTARGGTRTYTATGLNNNNNNTGAFGRSPRPVPAGVTGMDDDLAARLSGVPPSPRTQAAAASQAQPRVGTAEDAAAVRAKVQNALKELDELKSVLFSNRKALATADGNRERERERERESVSAAGTTLRASPSPSLPPNAFSLSSAGLGLSGGSPTPGPMMMMTTTTTTTGLGDGSGGKDTRINLSRIQSLMKKLYQKNMELSQQIHTLREENVRLSKGTSSLSALRAAAATSAAVVNASQLSLTNPNPPPTASGLRSPRDSTSSGLPPGTANGAGGGGGGLDVSGGLGQYSRAELLALIAVRDQTIQQLSKQHQSLRDRIDQFERDRSFIYPPTYGVAATSSGRAATAAATTRSGAADAKAGPAGATSTTTAAATAAGGAGAQASMSSAAARYAHEYAELHCDLMDKIDAYVRQQSASRAPAAVVVNQLQNQLVLEASARRLERMCYNDQILQLQQANADLSVKLQLATQTQTPDS